MMLVLLSGNNERKYGCSGALFMALLLLFLVVAACNRGGDSGIIANAYSSFWGSSEGFYLQTSLSKPVKHCQIELSAGPNSARIPHQPQTT